MLEIKEEYSLRLHDDMYVAWQDDTHLVGLGFKHPDGIRCVWGKDREKHEKLVASEDEMRMYFSWVSKFHQDWSLN